MLVANLNARNDQLRREVATLERELGALLADIGFRGTGGFRRKLGPVAPALKTTNRRGYCLVTEQV